MKIIKFLLSIYVFFVVASCDSRHSIDSTAILNRVDVEIFTGLTADYSRYNDIVIVWFFRDSLDLRNVLLKKGEDGEILVRYEEDWARFSTFFESFNMSEFGYTEESIEQVLSLVDLKGLSFVGHRPNNNSYQVKLSDDSRYYYGDSQTEICNRFPAANVSDVGNRWFLVSY